MAIFERLDGCAAAVGGAESAGPSSPSQVPLGGTARLAGIIVTPIAFLEDSRCPVDVVCVWAGRVRVRARVESAGRSQLAELELGKPVEILPGRRVVLSGASPDRSSEVPFERDSYLLSFAIE